MVYTFRLRVIMLVHVWQCSLRVICWYIQCQIPFNGIHSDCASYAGTCVAVFIARHMLVHVWQCSLRVICWYIQCQIPFNGIHSDCASWWYMCGSVHCASYAGTCVAVFTWAVSCIQCQIPFIARHMLVHVWHILHSMLHMSSILHSMPDYIQW